MSEQQKINVSPVEVIVMAVQLANSRGAFNLNEAAIISEAINTMLTSNTTDKPASRPQTELERMIINAHNNKKSEEEKSQSSASEKQKE